MRNDSPLRLNHGARWLELRVLMTTMSILLGACRDGGSLGIDPGVNFPISAQYDARRNQLLVASYENGSVQRVPLSSLEKPSVFLSAEDLAEHRALRIRIDSRRNRLWVLTFGAVYVYELGTGQFIQRIVLPPLYFVNRHCFSDMAVDHTGAAFISSTIEPKLFRVDGETFALTTLEIGVGGDNDKDFGFNALAFAGDGKVLFAASSMLGKLWRVDIDGKQANGVNISAPIRGACALKALDRKSPRGVDHDGDSYISLYVAGGFKGGVRRIEVMPATQRSWVTNLGAIADLMVTTDLVVAHRMMLIVHSPLMSHADFGGDGAPPPVTIVPIFQPLM